MTSNSTGSGKTGSVGAGSDTGGVPPQQQGKPQRGMDAENTTTLANPSPLIPAATVVLARDGADGMEVLMVERVGTGAFAGYSVFPGGRVDPEDSDPANPHDEFAAARRAAVREAAEEVGLSVDIDSLAALSHWTPPPFEMKRFGTWFFLAPTVEGTIVMSEGELTQFHWLTPAAAIAEHAEGRRKLAPPTWITLHSLRTHMTVSDASSYLLANKPDRFETWPLRRKPMVLAWEPDVAFKVGLDEVDLDAPGSRHRLFMDDDGWKYIRD
jgi:8-oxo-dGTP pyrophosphatase MutT (NUDIX family)